MRSRLRSPSRWVAPILILFAWANPAAPAAPASLDVRVTDAWIRWLPADVPSGAYMTLTNRGGAAVTLVGASSAAYGEVSFHRTRTLDGMAGMRPVATIVLKPGVPVRFAPGGYHLMLIQPMRAVHPGDRIAIRLRFADGGSLPVWFEVRTAPEN